MRELLEQLLRAADAPNQERAQLLWTEYRDGGPGANDAFATLLAWYGNAFYRRIWGFVRSDAAEDVFQNVLKKLHENRRSAGLTNFQSEVLPWLRKVADNECVSHYRRVIQQRRGDATAARPETDTKAEERRELQLVLADALAQLKPEQREAVAMHFFEGMDKQDAAVELRIDRKTFANRLNDGLARLQQLLPTKAVLAVGAVGLPTALSANPLPLPAVRLMELANAVCRHTARSWSAWLKPALVAAAVLTGGLAIGGWVRTDVQERKPSSATSAGSRPVEAETLQDRNRRLFASEVQKQLIASLSRLAMGGGGRATVEEVRCFDTRVACRAAVHHNRPAGAQSKWDIVYDTANGILRYRLDFLGNGTWRDLNPHQPMYWDPPWGGKRLVIRFAELDHIAAVFAAVHWADPRTVAESDARTAAFRKAAWSYEGVWFEQGDAAKPIRVRVTPLDPGPVDVTFYDGNRGGAPQIDLRVGEDGLLRGLRFHHVEAVPTPGGTRLDFPGTGFWWTREPTAFQR